MKIRKTYKIKVIETGAILEWTLDRVLSEINDETAEGWIDYDETDWEEGWREFVEVDGYLTMIKD